MRKKSEVYAGKQICGKTERRGMMCGRHRGKCVQVQIEVESPPDGKMKIGLEIDWHRNDESDDSLVQTLLDAGRTEILSPCNN